MKLIQCSRCDEKSLIDKTLPSGWHKTSDMPHVESSNVYMCPSCWNTYLRLRREFSEARKKGKILP